MRAGAVLPKQWHGASNTVSCALKGFLRGLLTGGVPKVPHPEVMYQVRFKHVAYRTDNLRFDQQTRVCPSWCRQWVVSLSDLVITLVTCAKAVI